MFVSFSILWILFLHLSPHIIFFLCAFKASGEVKALDAFFKMMQDEPARAFYGYANVKSILCIICFWFTHCMQMIFIILQHYVTVAMLVYWNIWLVLCIGKILVCLKAKGNFHIKGPFSFIADSIKWVMPMMPLLLKLYL